MEAQFIVCRDRLPLTASQVHATLDAATKEAARLCRKENATFHVFALLGEVRPVVAPVVWNWTALTVDDLYISASTPDGPRAAAD